MAKEIRYSLVTYEDLKPKQKENYNFAKISAVLADYGYVTMRISDDWEGADFIAHHHDGTFLKVQLKSRNRVPRETLPGTGMEIVEHSAREVHGIQ